MSKQNTIILIVVAAVIVIGFTVMGALRNPAGQTNATNNQPDLLNKRLTECGSFPNGSTIDVKEASRIFMDIPKDIYPDVTVKVVPHGATAGYVSDAGPYGQASDATGRPNCWSYYYEFTRTQDNKAASGTVDLISTSGTAGISDYVLHVHVTAPVPTSKPAPAPAKK